MMTVQSVDHEASNGSLSEDKNLFTVSRVPAGSLKFRSL